MARSMRGQCFELHRVREGLRRRRALHGLAGAEDADELLAGAERLAPRHPQQRVGAVAQLSGRSARARWRSASGQRASSRWPRTARRAASARCRSRPRTAATRCRSSLQSFGVGLRRLLDGVGDRVELRDDAGPPPCCTSPRGWAAGRSPGRRRPGLARHRRGGASDAVRPYAPAPRRGREGPVADRRRERRERGQLCAALGRPHAVRRAGELLFVFRRLVGHAGATWCTASRRCSPGASSKHTLTPAARRGGRPGCRRAAARPA